MVAKHNTNVFTNFLSDCLSSKFILIFLIDLKNLLYILVQ